MSRHGLTWLAIFGVIALMFLKLPQMVAKQDAVLNIYSALVEVDAIAHQKFVEPIRDARLVHGAIRGMMRQLDPYSGYIAPGELAAFMRRTQGEYIGIGIELGARGSWLTVIAAIDGGPAAQAGVLSGDLLLSVDDNDVKGLSVVDAEDLLTGPAGTSVTLRVQHRGAVDPVSVTIVRGPVSLHTVRGCRCTANGEWDYVLDHERRLGYIRVTNFLENTVRDFDQALASLDEEGIRGLIIDLRFNPGGIMQQSIAMVDRFVDEGLILSTVTRRHAVREYFATPHGRASRLPLAVLINGGSASSSEIVAGALQARQRALIVGTRSFGKGSVQHLIHLQEQAAAIKLTVAYYRLPDGRIIHRTSENTLGDEWGIIPDVDVPLTDDEMHAVQRAWRALDRRRWGADEGVEVVTDDPIASDRQLTQAAQRLLDLIPAERTHG